MIVTLPEETPVTEAVELATEFRRDIGLSLLPVVADACWPDQARPREDAGDGGTFAQGETVRPRDQDGARLVGGVRLGSCRTPPRTALPPRTAGRRADGHCCHGSRRHGSPSHQLGVLADALVEPLIDPEELA